jgi:uncharacterized protein GlcG (DUF336 family)
MTKHHRLNRPRSRRLAVESLESRMMLSASPAPKMVSASKPAIVPHIVPPEPVITASDVEGLLNNAAKASIDKSAIIAVVDRSGQIMGVRVEQDVPIADQATMVFAIDGAVALARTGAFFANGGDRTVPSAAPLTSRTVRFISQSTVTEREVESSPDIADPNSPLRGPGYVAPIGLGNHFPPGVFNAPQVDLFGIEQTNRGLNIPASDLVPGVTTPDTRSYGVVTGLMPDAQSRGIATLPGGIPLYKKDPLTGLPFLVGGIGVFFPGPNGFATFEQNFHPVTNPNDPNAEFAAENARTNAPLVLEAEWMAFAAAGGTVVAPRQLRSQLFPVPSVPGYGLPLGNLNLVGITLDVFGPTGPVLGARSLKATAARVHAGAGNPLNRRDADLTNPADPATLDKPGRYAATGLKPSDGWLVAPHTSASGNITAADVVKIVNQGIAQAASTRAAIRLQTPSLVLSAPARFVFAVSDENGNILGLYRQADATVFSIDVAVAKSRNTAYYASASLNPADMIYNYVNQMPVGPALVPAGVAFTNRTFRALAEPRFPGGIDGKPPGPFSSLNAPGIDARTAEDAGPALAASVYSTDTTPILIYTSFNVGANFRAPTDKATQQNGVVYFPGSSPLYKGTVAAPLLVGGFGTSGDGVDQDDVATVAGQQGYAAPAMIRADQYLVHGVRLPYQKFNRNPTGGV